MGQKSFSKSTLLENFIRIGGRKLNEETDMKTSIKNRMIAAAEKQRLDKLYETQVDENLFNDDTDFDRDPTGLFFDLDKDLFYFEKYVTSSSGWKDAHEQQNNSIFITFVDANTAVVSDLETLIEQYYETH